MATFKKVEESQVTISMLMLPSHANFSGKIHGGYILSLIDQIAFACASKHSGYYCVTASVDVVNFLAPIEVGEMVTLKASINFVGKTSMVVGIRVDSENIRTGNKNHCNSSFVTMVAKDDQGNTAKVPGLIIKTQNEIRRFTRAILRKKINLENQEQMSKANFLSTYYQATLEKYNVKIE